MSKQPTDWQDVNDWQDVGSIMEPGPSAARTALEQPDYLKGLHGYIKNPLKKAAKTTGTLTVRDGDVTHELTIGDNVPANKVPALIEANIRSKSSFRSNIGNAVSNFAQGVNPLPFLNSVYKDPLGTGSKVIQAQGAELDKAKDLYRKGEYSQAIGHGLAYVMPALGPAAANAGEQIQSGDVSGGLGSAAALLAPEVASMGLKGRSIPISPKMLTKNPAEASAVRFGLKEGLPVDAATATGNPAVRGLQWLADKSIGGSFVNASAKAEGASKLSGKLDDLANPKGSALGRTTFSVHPEQAGAAVRTALESKIKSQHGLANAEYSALRTIESDPVNLVKVQTGTKPAPLSLNTLGIGPRGSVPVYEKIALPVDTRAAKAALTPILEQMKRQMPETQRQASPGFKALENIVDGPDYAPASQVDRDLGAIKSIARGADSPYLRDVSQGIAAKSVSELGAAVDAAVAKGGQKAVAALRNGREATRIKYEVADVLDAMREEPVQAFNQMVYSKDAGINQLRSVATHAPSEMPKVGSAFLNDILDTATAQGGFDRAAGSWAKWDKLGPETKKILFKDPKYIQDLDDFFLLAKKLEENPNASGTATVGQTGIMVGAASAGHTAAVAGSVLSLAALSKIMHSPRAVNLMVNGLKVSGKVPVAAITAATLASALDSNTKKLDIPDNVPKGKR